VLGSAPASRSKRRALNKTTNSYCINTQANPILIIWNVHCLWHHLPLTAINCSDMDRCPAEWVLLIDIMTLPD
jgi:hypothetical protein